MSPKVPGYQHDSKDTKKKSDPDRGDLQRMNCVVVVGEQMNVGDVIFRGGWGQVIFILSISISNYIR